MKICHEGLTSGCDGGENVNAVATELEVRESLLQRLRARRGSLCGFTERRPEERLLRHFFQLASSHLLFPRLQRRITFSTFRK